MRERRSLICFARGKKIEVPDVDKIIVAVRTVELHQIQASMDVNTDNVRIIRKVIRRIP